MASEREKETGEKERMSRMSINRGREINRWRNISCVKGERNISSHRNRTGKHVRENKLPLARTGLFSGRYL